MGQCLKDHWAQPRPATRQRRFSMTAIAICVLIALPWLNPFSPGPTASVAPLLVSWACAAGLLLTGTRIPGRGLILRPIIGLALLLATAAIGSSGAPPGAEAMALAMSLLAALACAWRFGHATQADTLALARALLLAGLVSAVMGWLQYVGAADALAPWVSQANPGEAFGNLRQRNLYASLTSLALCALLWLARADPWFSRPVRVVGPAALLAAGNALSLSRTGLFELLLIMGLALVWGLWRERAVRRVLAPVLPAYLAAAIGLPWLFRALPQPGIFTRLTEGAPLCSSRMTLWSNILDLIAQQPWSGWGWGELDYAHYMTHYRGPRFCDILDNAHNLPLQLAVELGVPVALAVCGAGLWSAWRARPWHEAAPLRQMAWALLAVILLHSLLEYPLWYGPFQIVFGICLGLLWPWRRAGATRSETQVNPLRSGATVRERLPAVVMAALILAGVAGAALDYHRMRQIYLPPEDRAPGYRDDAPGKLRGAWVFRDQTLFAELTLAPLTPANAAWTLTTARQLLHFSPEPRVIEKLIESAVMLGHDDEALLHLARFRATFPREHAQWAARLAAGPGLPGKPNQPR